MGRGARVDQPWMRLSWTGKHPLNALAQQAFSESVPYVLGRYGNDWSISYDLVGTPHVEADLACDQTATIEARLEDALRQASSIPRGQVAGGGPDDEAQETGSGAADRPLPHGFREVGSGLFVGSPDAASAMAKIDRWLTDLFLGFEPVQLVAPGLVSIQALERSGYLAAFPHHVTTCAIVDLRMDAIGAVAQQGAAALGDSDLRSVPVALPPAACHHVYAYLADRRVVEPAVYGLRAMCGRHEPSGFGAYRRWSFQQRELVYVGTRQGARRFVESALDLLGRVTRAFRGPRWRVAPASDPFFLPRARAGVTFQAFAGTKHELLATLPGGDEVALGSVNLHRSYFGQRFGIGTTTGDPVHTACIGFGLERMATYFAEHFGLPPDEWPELVRPA